MTKTVTVYEFHPGCRVNEAAEALVKMAQVTDQTHMGEFNGKVLVAYRTSTVDSLLNIYWGRAAK